MKPCFTRPATEADALSVARRLTKEDREEVLANCGMSPELVLPGYVSSGREVYASGLLETCRPEILFGVDPIYGNPEGGVVWMLTTDAVYDHPVESVWNIKQLFEALHDRYPLLTNFIDARNTRHHKLLKWLGFRPFMRVEKFGAHSLPFIEFASYRPCA